MSLSINNNLMANKAADNMNDHFNKYENTNKRIGSGLRINSAEDDPAGLAISRLLLAEGAALRQGERNAHDGMSLLQTADGAIQGTNDLLTRMKELASQASTGTYNADQRAIMNSEYQAMAAEVTRISASTEFNGIKLLDGSASGTHDGTGLTSTGEIAIQVGTGNDVSQDQINIAIGDISAGALGVGDVGTVPDSAGSSIATQAGAQEALDAVNAAIAAVSQVAADIGAEQNRLASAIDSTHSQTASVYAAESRISDADIAEEHTKLVIEQTLIQSSLDALLRANGSSNMMIQLFSKQI